ncbi:glutathione peroxidase [Streptomyces sp. DHE17-7]|nr:glutathione peroxidase [Streptomyces sp. DHE17-7]
MTTSQNARSDDSLPLDVEIGALQGGSADLSQYAGRVVLRLSGLSGLTLQYARACEGGLYSTLRRSRGINAVLGVPCNQFMGQEPGSADEIAEFCSATYGVTFPMTEKVEVNGANRHPLYDRLTGFADAEGHSGDIRWNFEKFLIGRDGKVAARFLRAGPSGGGRTSRRGGVPGARHGSARDWTRPLFTFPWGRPERRSRRADGPPGDGG